MNREQEILYALEKLDIRLDRIEVRLSAVEDGQAEIRTDITGLKDGQAEMKEDMAFTRHTVAKIEIEQGQILSAVIDGQVALEEQVQDHTQRIGKLEEITDKHGIELTVLRMAK